jgi:exodeoxyribonuclease VII small subunit
MIWHDRVLTLFNIIGVKVTLFIDIGATYMTKKSFETSLVKLEEVVQDLEGGQLSLDDSLKKFEEGINLYKGCKDLLSKAEKKISVLSDSLKEEEYEAE